MTSTNLTNGTLMQNKRGIVMGVANKMSLAFHALSSLKAAGAEVALTSPNEKMRSRVEPIAEEFGCPLFDCDVTKEGDIENTFAQLKEMWSEIDFVVHAIAFSDKNELRDKYLNTSLGNFLNTMHISCYSLVEVAKYAEPLLKKDSSIVTLTYYGAEKAIPNYNVMGVAKSALESSVRYLALDLGPEKQIRVNAVSAGPVRTLASSGIGDFHKMLEATRKVAPMRENISGKDVGNAVLYLTSDLSTRVTGEIHHVDSGSHAIFAGAGDLS